VYFKKYLNKLIILIHDSSIENNNISRPSQSGSSGELRQVCMSAFPASEVIMGCSFFVAKVYTWPVSEATSSITWVPAVETDGGHKGYSIVDLSQVNNFLD
jgi:hypothetical protein